MKGGMNTFSENGNDFVGRLLHEGGVWRRTFFGFSQYQKGLYGTHTNTHTHTATATQARPCTRAHAIFTNTHLCTCLHAHRCLEDGSVDPAVFNYGIRKQLIYYSQRLMAHRMQVMMTSYFV